MNTIPPPFPPPAQHPQPAQPPANWMPAPVPPPAPAEPLEYHRLARTYRAYRWWKPLMVGLIALGLYLGVMIVSTIVFVVVAAGNPEIESAMEAVALSPDELDMSNPAIFAFILVSLILMLPVILLATRMMNVQKVGSLTSVAGRMRWGWLGWCMGVAFVLLALSFSLSFVFEAIAGHPISVDFNNPDMGILLIMTILLVPFQAAAEEYVFRGYLMQLIGGWLRHPAFAILLPIPLFVLGHGYDIYGQLDVGFFALAAGWLAWRTGGLEAAIALHVVNNSLLFAMGAVGLIDVSDTQSDLPSLLVSMATTVIFVLVVTRLAKKRNIARLSTPPAPVVTLGAWGPPGGWNAPPQH